MDNKKKTDSIMRYVVYLLCGALLGIAAMPKSAQCFAEKLRCLPRQRFIFEE